MTLLVDTKTPERLEIGDKAYLLRPPTVAERTRWRRAIAAAGGKQHGQVALLLCMADGVRALMADQPDLRDPLLARIDAHRHNLTDLAVSATTGAFDNRDEMTDEQRAALQARFDALDEGSKGLAVIETAVSAAYPRYADMVAADLVYGQIAGIEGARLFLVGWEGFDGDVVRGANGVSEDSLAQIPEGHLPRIGMAVEALTRVSEKQRKNSASPPLSSSGGETSSISKTPAPLVH